MIFFMMFFREVRTVGNQSKQINDQYGHVEGDFALKRAADALKRSCAENPHRTFIARYELTASIGYAAYSGDIAGFQTALARADEALYREKAAGKAAV